MGLEIWGEQRGFEKAFGSNGKETDYGSTEEELGHTEGLAFELGDLPRTALNLPIVHNKRLIED